jgi:hypothetical protein
MTDTEVKDRYEIRGWCIEDDDFEPDGRPLGWASSPEEAERLRTKWATTPSWEKVWVVDHGASA